MKAELEALARAAGQVEAALAQLARGEKPPAAAPPAVERPADLAALSRTLSRLGAWVERQAALLERLGAETQPELDGLLADGVRDLREGMAKLARDREAAVEGASRARSAAGEVERRRRRETGKDAGAVAALKQDSALRPYSEAADLLEQAATDLASAAARWEGK